MMNDNAVDCRQISKRYPDFHLDNIDLSVPAGSVMGFVGPNGAGKSTTLRIIMGLVRQDAGDVDVLGHPMPREQVAAKWEIGYVSEDMRLYPGQSIAFHMDFMRSIFPTWDSAYADTLLKRFGLVANQKIKGLSHGQRVKASLLMALAHRPRLVILDEPTTGLDPVARRDILSEMSAVLLDEDRTILFSSHNTLDVEQLSDNITFINAGSIIFSEDKEMLLERWRRVRLQVPEGFVLPDVPGLEDAQANGRLMVLTVSRYDRSLDAILSQNGAAVVAVERLSLEEIFLASVPASREMM